MLRDPDFHYVSIPPALPGSAPPGVYQHLSSCRNGAPWNHLDTTSTGGCQYENSIQQKSGFDACGVAGKYGQIAATGFAPDAPMQTPMS